MALSTEKRVLFTASLLSASLLASLSAAAPTSAHATGDRAVQAHVPLAKYLGKVSYGPRMYSIAVSTESLTKGPMAEAEDVPGGVVWLTPPGFPNRSDAAMADWQLFFTPGATQSGSLWRGSRLLYSLGRQGAWNIENITGSWVLLMPTRSGAASQSWIALDWRTDKIRRLSIAPGADVAYSRGVIAWFNNGKLTAYDLATKKSATFKAMLTPQSSYAGLAFVSKGLAIGNRVYAVPFIPVYPAATLPKGYRWVTLRTLRLMAVPADWRVQKVIPGGSSMGVQVFAPDNSHESTTVWINACAGCYAPTVSGVMSSVFDTPYESAGIGGAARWVSDHLVAYTWTARDQHSAYPSSGYIATYQSSGDTSIQVAAPQRDQGVARTILQSFVRLLPHGV